MLVPPISHLVPTKSTHSSLSLTVSNAGKTLCIFGRSSSDDGFKVFDEVRLIGISKLQYYLRPIHYFAAGQSFSHFMESIAFDHPLWTDTDILLEEPLHCPFVEVEPADDVINFGDFSMSDDRVNDLVYDPYQLPPLKVSAFKQEGRN